MGVGASRLAILGSGSLFADRGLPGSKEAESGEKAGTKLEGTNQSLS